VGKRCDGLKGGTNQVENLQHYIAHGARIGHPARSQERPRSAILERTTQCCAVAGPVYGNGMKARPLSSGPDKDGNRSCAGKDIRTAIRLTPRLTTRYDQQYRPGAAGLCGAGNGEKSWKRLANYSSGFPGSRSFPALSNDTILKPSSLGY